ncbi:MAG: hypothetical protein ABR584_01745 [Candidatus Baltobacteraceae bacterium]
MRKLVVILALVLIGANHGYTLKNLALPTGYSLFHAYPNAFDSGRTDFSLAANGMVAALAVRGPQYRGANRIIVWRRDGSRVALVLPSDALLARSVRQHSIGPNGRVEFPDASFRNVVLADDGTPFVTVDNSFSGAYSGNATAVFRWGSSGWAVVADYHLSDTDSPSDFTVEAASSPEHVLLTGDYSSGFIIFDAQERDPKYQLAQTFLLDGKRLTRVGDGIATAMAGRFISGYFGTMYGKTIPDNLNRDGQQAHAALWNGSSPKTLGPGIAFAINARGVAVGDDRVGLTGGSYTILSGPHSTVVTARGGKPSGSPVLWMDGRAHRLSARYGTSLGISEAGTVVGSYQPSGSFIYRAGVLRNLGQPAAYAINNREEILVRTASGLGLLQPASP